MQSSNIEQISVNVKDRYYILVGRDIVENLHKYVSLKKRVAISDSNVHRIYEDLICGFLEDRKYLYYFEAGEESKNYRVLHKIYDFLISSSADRYTYMLAFGGGVVGDVAAFAASTYMRGMPLVHIPTTLLAMVDSAIGGKTAINYGGIKNIIGSFYQPRLVLCDTKFLDTLPEREFNSALAEVIKYGIIRDSSLFNFIDKHKEKIKNRNEDSLREVVLESIKNKVAIVEDDEKEKGARALLNFGHTLAHAIESATGYEKYLHGEAVSIGSVFAANLSYKLGIADKDVLCRIKELLSFFGLPVSFSDDIESDALYEIMEKDKKNKNGVLRFILTKNIGSSIIAGDLDKSIIMDAIDEAKG